MTSEAQGLAIQNEMKHRLLRDDLHSPVVHLTMVVGADGDDVFRPQGPGGQAGYGQNVMSFDVGHATPLAEPQGIQAQRLAHLTAITIDALD